jgi:RNA polymerase sigma-70 factor (ECF subfamily)
LGVVVTTGFQSADAADIMQETLTAMSNALTRFESQPDTTFRGCLWTITRNKMRD